MDLVDLDGAERVGTLRGVADDGAVLVIAQVIVKVAAAQEELFADEEALDLFFGNLSGLGRRRRGFLRGDGCRRWWSGVFGGSG
jgi:hypothetical protein